MRIMSKNLPQCLKEKLPKIQIKTSKENTNKMLLLQFGQITKGGASNWKRNLKVARMIVPMERTVCVKPLCMRRQISTNSFQKRNKKRRFLLIILLATNGEKRRKKRVLPYPSRRKSIESEKRGRTIWSGNISHLSPRNKRARKKY